MPSGNRWPHAVFVLVALSIAACAAQNPETRPTIVSATDIPYGKLDESGCQAPPRSFFGESAVRFTLDDMEIDASAKRTNERARNLMDAAMSGAVDQRILNYAACRTAAKAGYTSAQRKWQEKWVLLLSKRPTQAEVNDFFEKNRFPDESPAEPTMEAAPVDEKSERMQRIRKAVEAIESGAE